jgi:Protein of unknown function (DUF551)
MNKWISVDKRLPHLDNKYHSRPVIIYTVDKIFGGRVEGAYYSVHMGFHTDEGLTYDGVLFWMEMPEPPNLVKERKRKLNQLK